MSNFETINIKNQNDELMTEYLTKRQEDLNHFYNVCSSGALNLSLAYENTLLNFTEKQRGHIPETKFSNILENNFNKVSAFFDNSFNTIDHYINESSDKLSQNLLSEDQNLLLSLLNDFDQTNKKEILFNKAQRFSSNKTSYLTIRAILDKNIWDQTVYNNQKLGYSEIAINNLMNASTIESRQLMIIGLNKIYFDDLIQKTKQYGFNHLATFAPMNAIANNHMRRVAETALDFILWEELRVQAKSSNSNKQIINKDHLKNTSFSFIGQIMKNILSDIPSLSIKDKTNFNVDNEDIKYDYQQTTVNIPQIIEKIVDNNNQYSWLKNYDENTISNVIVSIKTIRKEAKKQHITLSDRDIYILFRKKIETISSTHDTLAKENFYIIDALMSGNNKNQLPF